MKNKLIYYLLFGLLIFSISCSEDELSDFQKNDPDPEFALFTLLDDYPALRSAFNNIDSYEFNDRMCAALNNYPDETKAIIRLTSKVLTEHDTDALGSFKNIMRRILYQDDLDKPTDKDDEFSYKNVYYSWADKVADAIDSETDDRLNLTKPLLGIARKLFGYINYKYKGDELEEAMADFIEMLRDNEGTNIGSLLTLFGEVLGKLYLQADENIIFNESDTGLGNAVKGSDASFSGQTDEMKDPAFREAYYNLLMELGNIFTASITEGGEEKKIDDVLRELICNLENYCTKGDENDVNTYDVDPRYNTKTSEVFVDADLKDSIRELILLVKHLTKRSDRESSIIHSYGEPTTLLDEFIRVLKSIGFDPETANLEERLYDMCLVDTWGRPRTETGTNDLATEPFSISFIEHLLYLTIMGINAGWLDGGMTGEYEFRDANYNHGHGEYIGGFTINDIMCSIKTKNLGLPNGIGGLPGIDLSSIAGLYDLAFKPEDCEVVYRSCNNFSREERKDYRFFFDLDYSVFMVASPFLSGDLGVPWGGNPNGGDGQGIEFTNSYLPFCPTGIGEADSGCFFITLLTRSMLWGEGPYFTKEEMTVDGDVYTYYRPDGRIYVQITKPDLDDVNTWTYFYPADGGNDVEGEFDDEGNPYPEGRRERINNRYHDILYTDYTMCEMTDPIKSWGGVFKKLMNAANISEGSSLWSFFKFFMETLLGINIENDEDDDNNENWYVTPAGLLPGLDEDEKGAKGQAKGLLATDATEAGRMAFPELIPENCRERECETRSEAYFRNLTWVLTERKLGLFIPLYAKIKLDAEFVGLIVRALLVINGIDEENPPWWMISPLTILTDFRNDDPDESISSFVERIFSVMMDGVTLTQLAAFFACEGNGVAGVMNSRAFSLKNMLNSNGTKEEIVNTNGAWPLKSIEEGKLWYGQSYIPGDTRFTIPYKTDFLFKAIAPLLIALNEKDVNLLNILGIVRNSLSEEPPDGIVSELLWKLVLGDGSTLPAALSQALTPLARLAFPRSVHPETGEPIDFIGSRKGSLVPPDHPEWGFEANDSDPNWRNRGIIPDLVFPLIMALRNLGGPAVSKEEYYSRGDFLAPAGTKNALKASLELLAPTLLKPWLYYHEGKEEPYAVKAWIARLINGNSFFERSCDVPDIPLKTAELNTWQNHNSWEERGYYLPDETVNLLSLLEDSDRFAEDPKRCDGLLPLLTKYDVNKPKGPDNPPNTRIFTRLFQLVYAFTDEKFTDRPAAYDENDYKTWSARDKIRYGLEQTISSIKCNKSENVRITDEGLKGGRYPDVMIMPDYMYTDGIREVDTDLEKLLDELIGSNESGKGIAVLPDNRPKLEDWKNFNRVSIALGELLSNNGETGGRFNIMEDVIDLIHKLNTQVIITDDENIGFRHMFGSLFTEYDQDDGKWVYPDIHAHMLTITLPEILEVFKGNYDDLFVIVESLLEDNGFLEYFIYSLDSDYSAREVAEQLVAFLQSDIIARNDSAFWSDLAEMLTAFSDLIVPVKGRTPGDIRYNPTQDNSDLLRTADPFTGLGELLSW